VRGTADSDSVRVAVAIARQCVGQRSAWLAHQAGRVTAAWAGPAFQFPAMAMIASAGSGRSTTYSAASSRSASSPPGSPSGRWRSTVTRSRTLNVGTPW
jgi:hypothetical protein